MTSGWSTWSTSQPRTCIHSWRSQTHTRSGQCNGECLADRPPGRSAQVLSWLLYQTLILHTWAHNIVHHEAAYLATRRQWGHHAEGDSHCSTLDQASKWLEEMQHRLNLCIKTKQNVHPWTLVAFMTWTLSAVIQYRTIGNIWDTLYNKHQLRDSDITSDRTYIMISEFLNEVKLNKEQINTSTQVQKVKGMPRIGVSHAVTIGSQTVAV